MESQFKAGSKVVLRHSGGSFGDARWGRTLVVKKVYANGNFVLAAQPGSEYHLQQFKPDYDGIWAHQTGNRRYSAASVALLTPAVEKQIEEWQNDRANAVRGNELHRRLQAVHPLKLSEYEQKVRELLKILEAE